MNLGKLLATGRSFFGGGGVVSYREDKRVYLPKFNSAKNPFDPKTGGDAAPVPPPAQTHGQPAPAALPARLAAAPWRNEPKPTRSGNWPGRLNPFRGPEPDAPALECPVQTELSLQAVKVLHNDLSDADVEVVPVKSRTVGAVTPARLHTQREPLEFFGERRFETV